MHAQGTRTDIMTYEEYRHKKLMLLIAIKERTYELEELHRIKRDLIQDLQDLEKKKPQRGTEAFRE